MMETLRERDTQLEKLWKQFGDVPMNPDTEKMEGPFMDFPAVTDREEIRHWFDERHSKGVVYLLYGRPFYEKDSEATSALLEYIKQEVPFRLSEIFCIPDAELAPHIVDACIEDLYNNSDAMFDYDSIDDHIRGTLANYGINPDDYEEYKYGYDV